jgi:hypothetical protein
LDWWDDRLVGLETVGIVTPAKGLSALEPPSDNLDRSRNACQGAWCLGMRIR